MIAAELAELESEVLVLRGQTASARRLADEATMSLEQLEARLQSWEEQNRYQQNLLGRFHQQTTGETWGENVPTNEKITWLDQYLRSSQRSLYPQWQAGEVVALNGELQRADVLSLGPVSWFWQGDSQNGGFIEHQENRARISLVFDDQQSSLLQTLRESSNGDILFDPTLSRALRLAQAEESILDHIALGGAWVIPILGFALFAVIISLAKALQLWRLPKIFPGMTERLSTYLEERNQSAFQTLSQQVSGMQKELLDIVSQYPRGQIRDDQLFANLLNNKHKLDSWLGAIAVTAAVAPLLGLLGTVSGMIEAFRLMTLFGAGDPAAVSSGISEALVTTELGLIVAIPSLVLHALLSRFVKSYYGQLENCAVKLSQLPIQNFTADEKPESSTDAMEASLGRGEILT